MPSGHANHKGSSNKPNVNANGVIDDAVDEAMAQLLNEQPTNV